MGRSIRKRQPLFTHLLALASPRTAPVSPRGVPSSRPRMPVHGGSGGRLAGLPPVAQRTMPAAHAGRPRSSERRQPGPASTGGWGTGWGRPTGVRGQAVTTVGAPGHLCLSHEGVRLVTYISPRDIKGVRVAHVCRTVAGLSSPHRGTTVAIREGGSG